jgi:hypothetical protein
MAKPPAYIKGAADVLEYVLNINVNYYSFNSKYPERMFIHILLG